MLFVEQRMRELIAIRESSCDSRVHCGSHYPERGYPSTLTAPPLLFLLFVVVNRYMDPLACFLE